MFLKVLMSFSFKCKLKPSRWQAVAAAPAPAAPAAPAAAAAPAAPPAAAAGTFTDVPISNIRKVSGSWCSPVFHEDFLFFPKSCEVNQKINLSTEKTID